MYDDIEAINTAVTKIVKAIDKPAIQKFMRALVDRAQRCINAEGTYV